MKPPGAVASRLPWLSPSARSLTVLARSPLSSPVWLQLRTDPGLTLLAARAGGPRGFLAPSCNARILQTALHYLRTAPHTGFVDWDQPVCQTVYRACLLQAHLASAIAERVRGCDVQRAWVAGLLAPLGWIAACATDSTAVAQHVGEVARQGRRRTVNRTFDAAAVARRLNRRWRLPAWLAAVTGHLGLPVELAAKLGAEAPLFQITQLAVLLRQRASAGPYLVVGAELDFLVGSLGVDTAAVEEAVHNCHGGSAVVTGWDAPGDQPLLVDLLKLALRDERRARPVRLGRLHGDIDRLHEALEAHRADERHRIQSLKLSALAEFAAGAGHEINNPLAVISGQAQYLLQQLALLDGPTEEIDDPVEYLINLRAHLAPSLHKIVGQTQRIHGILTDLMQFARPTSPKPEPVDAAELMNDVITGLQGLADERRVRLVRSTVPSSTTLHADLAQARAALTALLRNAIEAAPPAGWAGLRIAADESEQTTFIVEDNGAGPGPLAREHLFDPFFSGRSAGRGRGLGLATAWRLARQQGGDVRFDGCTDGVTRFSLLLPTVEVPPAAVYKTGRNGAVHSVD